MCGSRTDRSDLGGPAVPIAEDRRRPLASPRVAREGRQADPRRRYLGLVRANGSSRVARLNANRGDHDA